MLIGLFIFNKYLLFTTTVAICHLNQEQWLYIKVLV